MSCRVHTPPAARGGTPTLPAKASSDLGRERHATRHGYTPLQVAVAYSARSTLVALASLRVAFVEGADLKRLLISLRGLYRVRRGRRTACAETRSMRVCWG